MGGRGSGGHPSGGRKPAEDVLLDGALPVIEPPSDLTSDERAVWDRLASLALQQRTLIPATVDRFRLLCRAILREQQIDAKIQADGLTYIAIVIDGSGQERESLKAHPLCGAHRGMMQRVEAGLLAFKLAPLGKPMAMPTQGKPKNALEALQARRSSIRAVK